MTKNLVACEYISPCMIFPLLGLVGRNARQGSFGMRVEEEGRKEGSRNYEFPADCDSEQRRQNGMGSRGGDGGGAT